MVTGRVILRVMHLVIWYVNDYRVLPLKDKSGVVKIVDCSRHYTVVNGVQSWAVWCHNCRVASKQKGPGSGSGR